MNQIEKAVEKWYVEQKGTAGDFQKLLNTINNVAVSKDKIIDVYCKYMNGRSIKLELKALMEDEDEMQKM